MRVSILALVLGLWLVSAAALGAGTADEAGSLAASPAAEISEAEALALGLAAHAAGDFEAAARLLHPLAVAGNVEAQMRIGIMHENGEFFPHSVCAAILFYDKAARAGSAKAMSYLASSYMTGGGIRRDLIKSYLWAHSAVRRGETNATAVVMATSLVMSDGEFAKAQRLAVSFRPEEQPPIDLFPVPPQWGFDDAWLADLGLAPCHLPKFLLRE